MVEWVTGPRRVRGGAATLGLLCFFTLGLCGFASMYQGLSAQVPPGHAIQVLAGVDSLALEEERGRVEASLDGRFRAYVVRSDSGFRLRIGGFPNRAEARASLAQVRSAGYDDAWYVHVGSPGAPSEDTAEPSGETVSRENLRPTPGDLEDILLIPTPVGQVDRGEAEHSLPTDGSALVGRVEVVTCVQVAGWVWDSMRPGERLSVDLIDRGALLATVRADEPRDDLAASGVGDGGHGFVYRMPRERGSTWRSIETYVSGTHIRLPGPTVSMRCPTRR